MYAFLTLLRVTAVLMFCAISATTLAAPNDPLNSAASKSALASRSVLVTVTRAGSRLISSGERGHILYSDDNGRNWVQATVPVSVTITALRFADEARGWAVGNGGVILRTDDGGATWTKQVDGRMLMKALSEGAAGISADRRKRLISEGADKPFLDIHVKNRDSAVAIGAYGLMFATADAGASWQPAFGRIGSVDERHLYALRKVGSSLYLAGEQGLLFKSDDDGASFQPLNSPGKGTFFSLVGRDADLVVMGLRGAAYQTRDGGANWRKIDIPTKNSLTDGRLSPDGNAFLFVDDGGSSWRVPRDGGPVQRLKSRSVFPFAGIEVAPDGSTVIVGALGITGVSR